MYYNNLIELRAWANPPYLGEIVDLHLVRRDHDKVYIAEPITWRELTPNDFGVRRDADFSLRAKEAQQLMDDLWKCGFRPTEGSGSAGALAATQAHLKDMQKIVGDVLPVLINKGSI